MDTKLETEDYLKDFLDVIEGFDEVFSDYMTSKMLDETYEYTNIDNIPGEQCSLERGREDRQEI